MELPLNCIDCQAMDHESLSLWRRRFIEFQASLPFNLATGPLLRTHALASRKGFTLVAVMHHMVSDMQSKRLFRRQFKRIYGDLEKGKLPRLLKGREPFHQFAETQRAAPVTQSCQRYWLSQLKGAKPEISLPYDHPRPRHPRHRGGKVSFQLNPSVGMRLDALALSCGCTRFQLGLAVFALFLARYSNQRDLCIGVPFSQRGDRRWRSVIGFFVQTLVMRVGINPKQSFNKLLPRVKQTVLDALDHGSMPFEQLVTLVSRPAHRAVHPLFQVFFTFRDSGGKNPWQGAESSRGQFSKFDLLLNLARKGGIYRGVLVYDGDLFDLVTGCQMARHLENLFESVSRYGDIPVGRLPLLGDLEREQVLMGGVSGIQQGRVPCLHQLFEFQVRLDPGAVSLWFSEEGRGLDQLTYGQLNEMAVTMAGRLAVHGVGPGERVVLFMERSPWMIASLLAVLKRGAAVVILDEKLPSARLAFILTDVRPKALITDSNRAFSMPLDLPVLLADASPTGGVEQPLDEPTTPDMAAYVLYTSGSSGQPKGVSVSHGAASTLFLWAANYFSQGECRRVLSATAVGFDVALFEWFAPLTRGGACVLARDHGAVSKSIIELGLSMVCVTPSVARLLMEWPLSAPGSITVNLAGERPSDALVRRLAGRSDIRRIHNIYGPTEAAIYATFRRLEETDRDHGAIGVPMAGRHAHVLDSSLEPQPCGVVGQLFLGGHGLASHYVSQASLTASRFIPDPHSKQSGSRLYATGDRVSRKPCGTLSFHGREDGQVKLRGNRIELGEIEAVLCRHPEVSEGAVKVFSSATESAYLAAFVVADSRLEGGNGGQDLQRYLANLLPDYMVPHHWEFLRSLPKLPSGKIDRATLPAPKPVAKTSDRPPQSPREAVVAKLYCEILNLPRVSVYHNFFALGGDSILAIQIASAGRREGLLVHPHQVVQHPNVFELAQVAEALENETCSSPLPETEFALSPIQNWYFELIGSQHHFFTQYRALDVPHWIDRTTLERALIALADHHDALRLKVHQTRGNRRQYYGPSLQRVPVLERSMVEIPRDRRHRFAAQILTQVQEQLDPFKGILFGAALLRRDRSQPNLLVIVAHHLVVDGVSWSILFGGFKHRLRTGMVARIAQFTCQDGPLFLLCKRDRLIGKGLPSS